MTDTMCGGKFDTGLMMRSAGSLHVSHVSRADDEESGPPEFMCHMWMCERPPHATAGQLRFDVYGRTAMKHDSGTYG